MNVKELLKGLGDLGPEGLELIRAALGRARLSEFLKEGWHVFHPTTPLIWGWHLDAICDHLEAVSRRDIDRLVINCPPGLAKSLGTAVYWPSWVWLDEPGHQWLFVTHSMKLTLRDAVRARELISSSWYQHTFEPDWAFKDDQGLKSYYSNTAQGARISVSVGSGTTGLRGDTIVIDDPLDADDRFSRSAREAVIEYYDGTLKSRFNNQATGAIVLIMQRLHDEDLAGHLLKQGGWTHLNLLNEYEPDKVFTTPIGWRDPRSEPGELLFPQVLSEKVTAELKRNPEIYSTQYQQSPIAGEGNIWERTWWKFWVRGKLSQEQHESGRYVFLPEKFDRLVQSWDMTFGSKRKGASYVTGQVWGVKGAKAYLLDQIRDRMDYVEMKEAIREMSSRWPQAHIKLLEAKALGPAIKADLDQTLGGFIDVNPRDDKVARASAVSELLVGGDIAVPDPSKVDWVPAFLHECTLFPNAANDDQVDTTSQFLNYHKQNRHRGKVRVARV
jgi:predicted phage terminase large subunit-like protein